jgi:putative transport protein
MRGFFMFLQQNPYLLLFFVVGLAVWIGRASIKGYGLGMVAGAIVVGAGLSVLASTYGVKLELNNFVKAFSTTCSCTELACVLVLPSSTV